MLAFPEMLLSPAEEAGMKVPEDASNFDGNLYPHFAVFCNVQLGSPMPHPTAHWDNARVIAAVPESEIRSITFAQLAERGIAIGYPIP